MHCALDHRWWYYGDWTMRRCNQRKWKRVILKRWEIAAGGRKVDHMDDSVSRVSWYLLCRTRGGGEMWAPCKRGMNHQDILLILTISRAVLEDILWALCFFDISNNYESLFGYCFFSIKVISLYVFIMDWYMTWCEKVVQVANCVVRMCIVLTY